MLFLLYRQSRQPTAIVALINNGNSGKSGTTHLNNREREGVMKTTTIVAIILIAVGIVSFAYQGISYTTREKVIDVGPIQVTADRSRTIPLPPVIGGVALVGGIVLLLVGARKE